MKKIITLFFTATLFLSLPLFAQNEYRFLSLEFGVNHNYYFGEGTNQSVLIKTVEGDMLKENALAFKYTPGVHAIMLINFDSKNDKTGFVSGIGFSTLGFKTKYKTTNEKYTLTEYFYTQAAVVPFYFKFWPNDIYREQSYFIIGGNFYYYMNQLQIQQVNWDNLTVKKLMPESQINKTGYSIFLGFNYYVANIQLEYVFKSFVNRNYKVNTDYGVFTPYSTLSSGLFLFKTSINIPLTRWTTVKSWKAEKIRRLFKLRNR